MLRTEHDDDYAQTIRDYLNERALPEPRTLWELGRIVAETGVAPWCPGPVMLYAGAALRDLIAVFYVLREDEHIAVKDFIAALPVLFNRDAASKYAAWHTRILDDVNQSSLSAMEEDEQATLKTELSELVAAVKSENEARIAAQERWTLKQDMTAAFERAWECRRLPSLPIPRNRDIHAAIQVASATATLSYTSRRQFVIEMLLKWSETR